MKPQRVLLSSILFAALSTGCSSESPPTAKASSPDAAAATSGATREASVGVLKLDVPTGWREEAPTNSMRAAQFVLPGGDGTTLVVFFFGVGGGGGVDANMERWIGQVTQPGGGSSADVAERSSETRGAFTLHHLDVSGEYNGGMSGGGGSNWRFLGTVVECEGGPYFFKLTGPAATVTACEADYEAALASLRL